MGGVPETESEGKVKDEPISFLLGLGPNSTTRVLEVRIMVRQRWRERFCSRKEIRTSSEGD